ncbi:MAG TPA: fumarylacetoacetate hydrolase family protein [Pseudolysinimonas sp.]|nr:fumarylacetoacetate hydrolase family protein [Pseudolysinimonas sp.]
MRPAPWAIVQFEIASDPGQVRLGIQIEGGTVVAAPAGWPATALQLLDEWRSYEPELRSLDPARLVPVEGAQLIAPLTFPRKVVCASANYSDHTAEMGDVGGGAPRPYFFLKPPTTTVVAPVASVPLPVAEGSAFDWEVELAVVIADRCRGVSIEDAFDHIAGYSVANDLSARGFFHRENPAAKPFEWDWYEHKAIDDSCPLGPGIVPHWLLPDVENLRLTLSVNDIAKQDSNTSLLVTGIAELVSVASAYVTLEPGDVILTGTPSGVGLPKGEFLVAGDLVVAEIDGIGRLETRILPAR